MVGNTFAGVLIEDIEDEKEEELVREAIEVPELLLIEKATVSTFGELIIKIN